LSISKPSYNVRAHGQAYIIQTVASTGNTTMDFDEKQSFECTRKKTKDEIFLCMRALRVDG
jgi:hypothetical protein